MEPEIPAFNEDKFKKGVFCLINSWPVLILAIENGWINENNQKFRESEEISENNKKKNWFQSNEEIVQNFSEDLAKYILEYDVTQFDIEDYLLDKMEEICYVLVEDNSEKQLAKILMDFFEDLNNGSDKIFQQILQNHENAKKIKVEGYKDKKTVENKDNTKVENLQKEIKNLNIEEKKKEKEPIIDEDGFILVQKKK